ncbi:hypothetical protein MNEG_8867 [Monoraphidium neglectum]|uniref:Uncharacterized protein n=1 Tax=Monoraphidium neglectum TaxID=145388 RepID=A0A0D2MY80_9CHLO|nr:hypothetical protein MNEG_8867 [Monoraphidium neglectum]KIY99095.1 hypothetical protein MNEG_8867 [Monoraphidium neglectum]|eukprot:XP_013898115.1 hypothetical protein MNEG_8867 [Monoraphidium neglectum]
MSASPQATRKKKLAVCAPVKALVKSCTSKAGPTALMDQLCSELLAPANATADSKVDRVSSDLAALEPKVTAAVAQASSLQATFVQGSNVTAALRAQVDELKAAIAALTAALQKLQAKAANATVPGTITQELAALAATDTRTAQQLALLEAANQTAARDIAALKSASQQCSCSLELSAVNTTLADIRAAQTADAAAVSLANATVESLRVTVTTGAAAIASVNTSLTALAANVANVSAIDLSVYAKTTDLANINAPEICMELMPLAAQMVGSLKPEKMRTKVRVAACKVACAVATAHRALVPDSAALARGGPIHLEEASVQMRDMRPAVPRSARCLAGGKGVHWIPARAIMCVCADAPLRQELETAVWRVRLLGPSAAPGLVSQVWVEVWRQAAPHEFSKVVVLLDVVALLQVRRGVR